MTQVSAETGEFLLRILRLFAVKIPAVV